VGEVGKDVSYLTQVKNFSQMDPNWRGSLKASTNL
jgi:hypothetical protein